MRRRRRKRDKKARSGAGGVSDLTGVAKGADGTQ